MLRRNREITIFNLSAIDLFCSGMGAVMVLMIILMPYYRKQDPAPPEPASVVVATPEVVVPPAPAPPPPDPVPTPPVPGNRLETRGIDVVFVMDATGSMERQLQSVQTSMHAIIQVLRRISDEAAVGFVAFIDRGVQTSIPLRTVAADRQGERNVAELIRGISRVRLIGNEDWPEDVHAGLQNAASMPWPRPQANRRQIIIVIGDARTHPADHQRSMALVRSWVEQGGGVRSVHAVFTLNQEWRNDREFQAETRLSEQYYRELASVGQGAFHEGEEDLLGSILDIIIVR